MISRRDEIKANANMCKFVENTQRVIGKTKLILEGIMKQDRHINNEYSDVPGLLDMAKDLLVGLDHETQLKCLRSFIKKSSPVWYKIKEKDDTILTENLSLILPSNPYVPRIQYIYGNNERKIRYVGEEDIKVMWKLLNALVHNSVKYIIFSEDSELLPLLPEGVIDDFKISLE